MIQFLRRHVPTLLIMIIMKDQVGFKLRNLLYYEHTPGHYPEHTASKPRLAPTMGYCSRQNLNLKKCFIFVRVLKVFYASVADQTFS